MAEQADSHRPSWDREIRVFVSSTFRDMQEDRDWLVKHIFPQLRKLCESRGVTWREVDLRWGITDDAAAEGKVLPLCLEEIKRCRPYFIGLLGERYGWVPKPEEIPDDLLEREAWLKDHRNHSVTELEIIHGVLREEEMHRRAYFYFRDAGYFRSVPPDKSADYCEAPTIEEAEEFGPDEAERRAKERKDKLDRLKQRIRAARDEEVCRLRENYHDPKQLGEWILEDFDRLINELYPEGEQPEDLDREAAGHEAFARSRLGVYIGRQEYFNRLDAHVAGDGPPLVILGESGSGKTALLANWFLGYQAEHPDDFSLIHFIGSTADSADATQLMQRIMLELKRRFDLPGEVPVMPDAIRDAFPQWLNDVAGSGRIVLVLDALNQLDDRDHAPDLGWLPRVLPKNVRLIVSTLPGRSLDAVERRNWPEMTVQPLTVPERKELIEKFLAQFARKLSASRVERIAATGQTANPLFLRAMLDELRQFGEHDRLEEMIDHYLEAPNPQDLYDRILRRWEQDYGEDLVRRSMSLLWAARRGLAESELLDLLGTGPWDERRPLEGATWTPFHLTAESALARRSGLLAFFHDYLRAATAARYLLTDEQKKSCHRTLAEYFLRRRPDTVDRFLDELPWQWQQAEEWDHLKVLLTERPVFLWLRSTERWRQDLQAYWLSLKPHHNPREAYRQVLDRWETEADEGIVAESISHLALFHNERAEHTAAEPLMRRALAIDEASYGPDHPTVAIRLNNLAQLLEATNRLAEAEPLYHRALAIDEQSHGPDHPKVATGLNNLAGLLRATNRLAAAEPLMRRALAIDEASYGPDHPTVAGRLNNLAQLLEATNRLAEAEPLMRRSLAIDERSYGMDHPVVARDLNNLAELLRATNRLAKAEPLYRRVVTIFENSLGEEHPDLATALNNLARLLQATNRLAEAEPLIRRALAIWEESLGDDHPNVASALNNLAQLLQATNRLAEAEPLYRRALAIVEASYGPEHPEVATDLNNLALLLYGTNRLAEAEPLMRRALAIKEQSYGLDHPTVATGLNNLAQLLYATNRLAEAEPLYRRVVTIFEASLGEEHPNVATALNGLAALLCQTNRLAEAEPLVRRALAIDEASYGPDHPDVAIKLNNLAALLRATNRLAEAEPLYRRALAIDEASYGPDHPVVAIRLNNLAELLKAANRLAEAEPLYRRAVEILLKFTQEIGHPHPHLQGALGNYAILLQALGRSDAEIQHELGGLLGQYGLSAGGGRSRQPAEAPSPALRAVIEEVARNPSQAQDIAARLQREDTKLFLELVQWIQNQQ